MYEIREISREPTDRIDHLIAIARWLQNYSSFEERPRTNPSTGANDLIGFAERLELVTNREFEIFENVIEGMTAVQIGAKLEISPRTVDVHKARFIQKMGVSNMVVAARYFAVLETLADVRNSMETSPEAMVG